MYIPFGKKVEARSGGANLNAPSSARSSVESIVKLENVKVVYFPGKNNEVKALDGIDLEIYPNEYIIIFGPSGCGKSTLLNIIAGLEVPNQGKVIVDGQNLSTLSSSEMAGYHRRKIGMIFQLYNLIPSLNVLKNIVLPQVFERVKRRDRIKAARALLEDLNLVHLENRLPQELSGGQQQQVSIARALINNPLIIMADEAVGNLDSTAAENVLGILNNLNLYAKKTIISVTHNPEHLYYADRIVYMKDGKIIKIEINEKRKKLKGESEDGGIKKIRTELDLLLQAYPDLSAMQLHVMLAPFKAKMLVAYLINKLESEEIKHLEGLITQRLIGEISSEELLHELDTSADKGGLGLNWSTARKFFSVIEEVVHKAEYIKTTVPSPKACEIEPLKALIDEIRKTLLYDYDGELTLEQVEALDKGIEFRILSKINRKELQEYLDRPIKKGGVGLNRRSAANISRKLEIIMLVRFGDKAADKNQ